MNNPVNNIELNRHKLPERVYLEVNNDSIDYINNYRALWNLGDYKNPLTVNSEHWKYHKYVKLDSRYNLIGSNNEVPREFIVSLDLFKQCVESNEDEFVLPEKWYIKACPELKTLCDEHRANINGNFNNTVYYNFNDSKSTKFWRSWLHCYNEKNAIDSGFKNISFDQFIKYVLKQDVKSIKKPKEEVQSKSVDLNKLQVALEKVFDKTDVEDIMDIIKKNI